MLEEEYWQSVTILVLLGILSIIVIIPICILTKKGRLWKPIISAGVSIFMVLMASLCVYLLIPLAKDYRYISSGEIMEDNLTVIEFTDIHAYDEFGGLRYTEPKFYIESKDEYIVLNGTDDIFEVGVTYRIRYLPNSKKCEVLYRIENDKASD